MAHWTENLTTHERRVRFGGLTQDKINEIENRMARHMEGRPLTAAEARLAELYDLEATRRLTDAEEAELAELTGADGDDW